MRDDRLNRRGMLLVEMLVTIGLIAIFVVLSGKLFTTTLRLTHASHNASGTVATFESCIGALRRDAWGASETIALPEGGVRITRGDGVTISWSTEEGGALVRRSDEAKADGARRWPGMGTRIALQVETGGRGALIVRAGDDRMRLVSQVALARAGEP